MLLPCVAIDIGIRIPSLLNFHHLCRIKCRIAPVLQSLVARIFPGRVPSLVLEQCTYNASTASFRRWPCPGMPSAHVSTEEFCLALVRAFKNTGERNSYDLYV